MEGVSSRLLRYGKTLIRRGGLIYIPVAVLGFFSPASAQEAPVSGLSMTVYNNYGYNASPPLPDQSGRPIVGTTTVENADRNFDANPPFNMYEDFIVKFDGHITAPISGMIQFLPTGDDGTKLFIDGILVDNNWRDKGGGGNPTGPISFTAGESKPFTLWFYENGGGAWVKLYWNIGNGWEVVPASAFTQTIVTPTTTTTTTTLAPYLNPPQNIVVTEFNDSSVHLTWTAPEQSNVEVERYAVSWSTDNFVSNGWGIASTETSAIITGLDSGTNYQFHIRADNDSLGVYSQWGETASVSTPTTTTTTTTTSTTTTTTTTTTTIPETTTTWVPETTSTVPATTSTTTAPTTIVPVTTTTVPPTTTTTSTTTLPPTTTTSTTQVPAPTTTLPLVEETLTGESPEDIANNLLELNNEELSQVIEELDLSETSIEAIEAIFSGEVLSELTDEQVSQLIEDVASADLTDEQAEALSAALTEAPTAVKEAFQETVNVFGGQFDTYVPTGSQISVGARRVVVAATAVVVIAPAPVSSRRK